ncbi:hypothetical protein [Neptuniibacter sp. QD37_11]|uniref:hypothetical protein n=1 Tax=Neptuniibacter sp. QD37_11 TaxID=3398209 RepID=UPI0039F63142
MSEATDLMNAGFNPEVCPGTHEVMPNVTKTKSDSVHVSYCSRTIDYGCATTAMVFKGRVFFILNGNHAQAWDAAIDEGGVSAGLDYFIEHLAEANPHSEHRMAVGIDKDRYGLMASLQEVVGGEGIQRVFEAVLRESKK